MFMIFDINLLLFFFFFSTLLYVVCLLIAWFCSLFGVIFSVFAASDCLVCLCVGKDRDGAGATNTLCSAVYCATRLLAC